MSDGVGKRIRKNTGLMLGAKIAAAIMALLGLMFAARGLTTEEFGILVFLHAYILFFTEIATFDSWLIIVKHAINGKTGKDIVPDDLGHFGRVIRFCVSLDFLAASTGFAFALTLAYALNDLISILQAASPYIFFYSILIFLNQKSASLGLLRLFDRYDLIALNSLTIAFVRMTGCGFAWFFDGPFVAYVAVWFAGSAISYLTLPLLASIQLRRRDLWKTATSGPLSLKAPVAKLWRFVIYTNIDTGLAAGTAQLPVILAGVVGGPAFAAIFRIAQEVAMVLSKGAQMMDKIIYPEFTNLMAQGDGARIPGLVLRTGGIMMAIGSAIGLLFWVVGPQALSALLGPNYAQAANLSVLLIIAASLTAASAPLFPAFYARGKPKKAIFARISGLVVMIVGFFVLYEIAGQLGPGFAIMAGALITMGAAAYIAKHLNWASPEHQPKTDKSN